MAFPAASQPDIVLSCERDDFYASTALGGPIEQACEVALGLPRTSQLLPELNALAHLLYYGFTLLGSKRRGAPPQTLGQEYCSTVFDSGKGTGRLSTTNRATFVFLVVLLPYLARRLERGGWGEVLSALRPLDRETRVRMIWQRMTQQGGGREPSENEGSIGYQPRVAPLILHWWMQHKEIVCHVAYCGMQFHLMVFFFTGKWFSLPHRFALARSRYTKIPTYTPAKYTAPGVLLAVQLAMETTQLTTSILSAISRRRHSADRNESVTPLHGVPRSGDDGDTTRNGRQGSKRCVLCMNIRRNPSATPCGHIYCWDCIVPWCMSTPECPLCRRPTLPQSIVCLFQYE
eukprot:313461_1